jgi:ankyrin repeat protein
MKQKGGAEIILLKFIQMVPEINGIDSNCNNILHHVVESGDFRIVNKFLNIAEKKGKLREIINCYNDDGLTPLHIAVKNNFQAIAEILVLFGANKNIPDNNGQKVIYVPEQIGGDNTKVIYGKRYL